LTANLRFWIKSTMFMKKKVNIFGHSEC